MYDVETIIDLVLNRRESELREILDDGADPDCRDQNNRTPLHWAAQEGYAEIINCLLEADADIEAQDNLGFTPLAVAAGEGHIEAVSELLRRGARPNTRVFSNANGSAVHLAASWGHLETIKLLSEVNAVDLNQKDDEGRTPLFFAKDGGYLHLSEYLISRGAK